MKLKIEKDVQKMSKLPLSFVHKCLSLLSFLNKKTMKKLIPLLLISVLFFSCEKFNTEFRQPVWVQKMTDTLETNDFYWGSKIYRHEWKSDYYYHLNIPVSSCAYCNIYNKNGESVDWQKEDMEDYLENRKNEQIVWRWQDKTE